MEIQSILTKDLKCCGNCEYSGHIDNGRFAEILCSKFDKFIYSNEYCESWKFDCLSQDERKK